MPTIGRLSARSIRLPTYMDAMKPQKSSGCCVIRSGPGETPWTMRAASITAGMGPEGAPSAGMGAKPALDRVGDEARDDVGRARDDADEEAEHGAAADRHHGVAPLLAGGQELPQLRLGGPRRVALPRLCHR